MLMVFYTKPVRALRCELGGRNSKKEEDASWIQYSTKFRVLYINHAHNSTVLEQYFTRGDDGTAR